MASLTLITALVASDGPALRLDGYLDGIEFGPSDEDDDEPDSPPPPDSPRTVED